MADKNGRGRTRNFATVVYPESCPADWVDRLIDSFVPAFISPLHDADIDPLGQPKKPHYHVIIMYDGVKNVEQAQELFDYIGGVGCEKVQSIRGYARYLCHMDNPEKAQYKTEDVRCFCGADYPGTIGLAIDKYNAVGEMIDFCALNNIVAFSDLLEYAREFRFDWFRCLCDNSTLVMKEYLKSRSWTIKNGSDLDNKEV